MKYLIMKGTDLGALEELVLLATAALPNNAYAVLIKEEIESQSGRSINISSIHTTLHRLEEKGFLKSEMGGATTERGGRRKRFFKPTNLGFDALKEARNLRSHFWNLIPQFQS